jgi:hypothetical protein
LYDRLRFVFQHQKTSKISMRKAQPVETDYAFKTSFWFRVASFAGGMITRNQEESKRE